MKIDKKTIIYILGAGRSGTTLLDIILGNQNGIFSCGELNRYALRDGIPLLADEMKQSFWFKIRKQFIEDSNFKDLSFFNFLISKFEYHSGFLFSFIYRNKKDFQLYKSYTNNLYTSIFNSISEDVIIDSSKHPGRLFNLVNNDFNVKVIFLKRNYSDVIKSFRKKDIEQPSKNRVMATIYYLFINLLCYLTIFLLKKKVSSIKINFNALLSNPNFVFKQIEDVLNVDLQDLYNREEYIVGNLFDGNRIRLNDKLKIENK